MLKAMKAGERLLAVFLAALISGCGTVSTYSKVGAPWGSIQRVAVLPFSTPTENPVRRQLVTQLFAEELRKIGISDVVEVPLSGPVGGAPSIQEVAQQYQVDGVFSGSVDETQGTVVHVRLQDAATAEVIWSGTALLGVAGEFFSLRTQQQQVQRQFKRLAKEVAELRGSL